MICPRSPPGRTTDAMGLSWLSGIFIFDKFVRVLASVIKLSKVASGASLDSQPFFPSNHIVPGLFTDISVTCSILRTDWIPVISRYRLAVLLLSRGCDVLLVSLMLFISIALLNY